MTRTLIRNGYVVTVNAGREVHPGGFVAVDAGRIAAVGPAGATPPVSGFDETIDAGGTLVLPGLINLHQHHWYTLFKGAADGFLLEDWISDFVFPIVAHLSDEAMRVASYAAAMEMLATGTTCSLNHSVTTTTDETVEATIEPQAEVGIRQVFAKELRCRTPGNPRHPLTHAEALEAFEDTARRYDGRAGGLVRMAMVIESNAYWVGAGMSTEALIGDGYALARRLGLRITDHVAAGTFSLEKGFLKHLRETGRTDVRYLMNLGLLDERWILIHGIHATELDLEHMAQSGCSFVYTPTSEAMRGGGIAPFAAALRAGINVALGTDGPMVDYSVDMVEQMKACAMMQHVRHLDPSRMPVERTLEMATINGARALGLEHEIGSLEAGKRADIALFDLTRPHVGVLHRPLSTFVGAGKGSDARMVMVDGRIVYRDGRFPNVADPDGVIADATRIGRAVLEKAGLAGRLAPAWR